MPSKFSLRFGHKNPTLYLSDFAYSTESYLKTALSKHSHLSSLFLETIMSLLSYHKRLSKKITSVGSALLLTSIAFSMTGCSTTQEIKPTASVMVGAHKSI